MPADFFTTDKRTLGVVLSNTTPPLRVPEYQRDFSWEQQQLRNFGTTSSTSTRPIPETI